jgi:hypothetical protein
MHNKLQDQVENNEIYFFVKMYLYTTTEITSGNQVPAFVDIEGLDILPRSYLNSNYLLFDFT